MKMLDPGSTVREGEFATAQNAGGVSDTIAARYNQVLNGERLTEAQRADFLSQAAQQYSGATQLFEDRATQYKDIAQQYGYKPERIVQGVRKNETPKNKPVENKTSSGWSIKVKQ